MSAAAGSPSLRSRIAERLGVVVVDQGARAVGRQLGVDGTTVGRWSGDVYAWGFHAVDLAIKDDELWAAIVAYRDGDHIALYQEAKGIKISKGLAIQLAQSVFTANKADLETEAAKLLKMLRRIVQLVTERVIPDLEALDA